MNTPNENEPDDDIETVEAEEVEANGETIAAEEIGGENGNARTGPSEAEEATSGLGWRTKVVGVVVLLLGIAALAITFTWPAPALWLMARMPAPLPALAASDGRGAARIAALETDRANLKTQLQALQTSSREQADKQARFEQSLAAVNGAVAELRDSVTALQESNAERAEARAAGSQQPAPADAGQLTALEAEIASLREQLAAQEARAEDLAGKLAASGQRLSALEEAPGNDNALILAVGQLQGEIAAGRPFTASLKATTVLAQDAGLDAGPVIALLAPMAGKGIATRRQLQAAFDKTLAAVLASGAAAQQGFWQRTLTRVTGLVSVRRTGEVAGGDAEAIMARAEVRMNDGNMAGAVKEMTGLSGPAAGAAAPWLTAANNRLAAEAASAKLQLLAISSMAKN